MISVLSKIKLVLYRGICACICKSTVSPFLEWFSAVYIAMPSILIWKFCIDKYDSISQEVSQRLLTHQKIESDEPTTNVLAKANFAKLIYYIQRWLSIVTSKL